MKPTPPKYWFVLYTKPRHEFKAEAQIKSINVETYLPTTTVIKQWSDRKKKVTEPLFKSYIFIYADEKERLNSLEQNGVVATVCFKGKPAHVPEIQIENLRKLLAGKSEVEVTDKIEINTRVRVDDGPFAGIEGVVFENENNDKMLGITIDLLNRTVAVKLPKTEVTVINK
ncbi:MAG: UpxY family transcription antiterminator [Ignavibacteriae bacterium]|jgi:transcription antitermination factor NusG|nr:UpxY family transcription antiterminator [Ignavibacteriota bacterium]NOG98468.1 UpxY family transcription antiterminator [Ignavibacteriota bacterium]